MKRVDRNSLRYAFKLLSVLLSVAIAYVLLDFAIDIKPAAIQNAYRFSLKAIEFDRPVVLRQDNLQVLIIRRSQSLQQSLRGSTRELQDRESNNSHQPAAAKNTLRSVHPEYYVSYAIGTDFGCPLKFSANLITEVCGNASYDFAGRAIKADSRFQNLSIPDYTFSDNFKLLTIKP